MLNRQSVIKFKDVEEEDELEREVSSQFIDRKRQKLFISDFVQKNVCFAWNGILYCLGISIDKIRLGSFEFENGKMFGNF